MVMLVISTLSGVFSATRSRSTLSGRGSWSGTDATLSCWTRAVISFSKTSRAPVRQVVMMTSPKGRESHRWSFLKSLRTVITRLSK